MQPLTRAQLLDLVRKHGIPESAFCFGPPSAGSDDVISVQQENRKWVLHYHERGDARRMDTLDSENAAHAVLWRALRLTFLKDE